MLVWPASGSAIPDRTTIDRYLRAELKFAHELIASIPASLSAAKTNASGIEVGCPNALAGVPAASYDAANAPAPRRLQPQAEQLSELKEELSQIVLSSTVAPERGAQTALLKALRTLHWRDRKLARAARVTIRGLERPARQVPDACADMRSWQASGYLALPRDTTTFLAPERSSNPDLPGLPSAVRSVVQRGGTRYEQADVRRLIAVVNGAGDAFDPLTTITQRLETALGLGPGGNGVPSRAVALGRGMTAAGTSFLAKVTPAIKLCLPSVNITETDGPLISSFGGETCTIASSASVPAEPSVRCDVGLLKVQARVLPSARSVRLLLSNGKTLDSRVLLIPAAVPGAPGGFYYQAVRGPSPIPVSLTELDTEGHSLAVLALRAVRDCAFR